jgi:hypothetical protein
MLDFDDGIFLDFVLSRLESGRKADGPFNVSLVLFDECEWELSRAVTKRLQKLQAQKKVVFSLSSDEDYLLTLTFQ